MAVFQNDYDLSSLDSFTVSDLEEFDNQVDTWLKTRKAKEEPIAGMAINRESHDGGPPGLIFFEPVENGFYDVKLKIRAFRHMEGKYIPRIFTFVNGCFFMESFNDPTLGKPCMSVDGIEFVRIPVEKWKEVWQTKTW